MADINKVVVVGRLTRDAEQQYNQGGTALLKFSIAVNRWRKDQNQEEASFFDVTAWGRQGEAVAQYMTKGKQVAVDGELRQDRWQDKNDGSNRSKVYIVANNIQLLGGKDGGNQGNQGNQGYGNQGNQGWQGNQGYGGAPPSGAPAGGGSAGWGGNPNQGPPQGGGFGGPAPNQASGNFGGNGSPPPRNQGGFDSDIPY